MRLRKIRANNRQPPFHRVVEYRWIIYLIACQISKDEEISVGGMMPLEKWKWNMDFTRRFGPPRIFLCVKIKILNFQGNFVILPADIFSLSPSLRQRECGVEGRGQQGVGLHLHLRNHPDPLPSPPAISVQPGNR